MSTSFKITGGDLTVATGRTYDRVSGAYKLAQDLRLWVLEQIGTDPSTPTYGSTLDGGVIDGAVVPSVIGQIGTPVLVGQIRSEIISLISTYQQNQLAKMKSEMLQFNGQTSLDPDEILQNIVSVNAAQVETQVIVQVVVQTLADTTLQLTIPVDQAS